MTEAGSASSATSIVPGISFAKIEKEHKNRGDDTQGIGQEHRLGILPEADVKIAGRDDVGEVGDDQRVGGGVADETARHQKGEDGDRVHLEVLHLGKQDRGEDERGAVIGEEGCYDGTEQQNVDKHQVAVASAEMGHLQRRPFEKADLVKHHRKEDDTDKGEGGIPDDRGDGENIVRRDDTQKEGGNRSDDCRRSYLKPFWLPDDKEKGDEKKRKCQDHRYLDNQLL